jgi:cysteine desulfurase NifS
MDEPGMYGNSWSYLRSFAFICGPNIKGQHTVNPIYLDNNATTMVSPEVVEAMLPFFTEQYGNPSSMHAFGSKVGQALLNARRQVQELLGAEHDSEIIFTSCGSESDSTAILSALKAQPERKEIITTNVEHPAVLNLCNHLEKEGYKVHYLPVDEKGRIDILEYSKLLSDNVAIVSVMWANNETGTLFPVEEMAELAADAGVMFHTDAVQVVGKLPIRLKDTQIDMLSLSGHKLHAPKGVGVLYVRRGVRFRPLLRGGHQERGRRAGTENSAGIVALGKAAELAMQHMEHERTEVKRLRDKLEKGHPRPGPAGLRHRRPRQPAPQHRQHRLRVHRRGGDPAAAEQGGDRRQFRLRLHLRLPGAVPRHAGDGHPLHRGPRHHPLLPLPLHQGGGDRPRHRHRAGHRRQTAQDVPLLGRQGSGGGAGKGLRPGLRLKFTVSLSA